MIAVLNKNTNKYLSYFSDSFNDFYWKSKYKLFDAQFMYEMTKEEEEAVFHSCFSAELNVDNIKIFASVKGAKSSLGSWARKQEIEFVELIFASKNNKVSETEIKICNAPESVAE